jgi:DNA recombination protein RmuC
MDSSVIILGVVILFGFAFFFWWMNRRFQQLEKGSESHPMFSMLHQSIQGMQERLDRTQDSIGQRLDHASNVISGVSRELGHVQEIGRQMQDLQHFLRSPKLRGNIGEQVLRDLLEQTFSPEHIEMQYKFQEGQMVDAIIRTSRGIIPIDSKFPLENFQKYAKADDEGERELHRKQFIADVKKHISDIGKKYILPVEGTVDFAVMYVPSETIYYEIIRQDEDLMNFGTSHRVLPVSPNSFYYFLRVIMMGMEGERIELAAKKMMQLFGSLQKDGERFGEDLSVLRTHLTNARGALDRVDTDYERLNNKIDQMKLLK